MQNKLKSSAQELSNSEALETILTHMQDRMKDRLVGTPDDELVALKQEYKAIDALRGEIKSQLLTYLETDK